MTAAVWRRPIQATSLIMDSLKHSPTSRYPKMKIMRIRTVRLRFNLISTLLPALACFLEPAVVMNWSNDKAQPCELRALTETPCWAPYVDQGLIFFSDELRVRSATSVSWATCERNQ